MKQSAYTPMQKYPFLFLFFFLKNIFFAIRPHAMNGNIYIPLFEVFRRYKRHGLDDSISQLVPNLNLDFSTLFVGSAGNVTHGDVFAEGRRRDTRSDHTYFLFFFYSCQ